MRLTGETRCNSVESSICRIAVAASKAAHSPNKPATDQPPSGFFVALIIAREGMSYPRKTARQRGYSRAWERARLGFLAEHPLCVMCLPLGRRRAATVVDHVIRHDGDPVLFWDVTNWQALCKPCHDGTKQSQEKSRALPIGKDGVPVDVMHHWNTVAKK